MVGKVECNFSVKEITVGKDDKLQMGKLFYNHSTQQIHYSITFPIAKSILATDKLTVVKRSGLQKRDTIPSPGFISTSMFNLACNNNMEYFGLDKAPFELVSTKVEEELVVSTWKPKGVIKDVHGNVTMAQRDGRLFAINFYSPNGKMTSQQFFEDYIFLKGYAFPTKVIAFVFNSIGKKVKTTVTEYTNLVANSESNEVFYSADF
ncbi:MAG: hypothetical protein HRT72_04945 [Flavobacteriales bacterium]|nr:hypothetical protein [Flavobacteriales bacterium]